MTAAKQETFSYLEVEAALCVWECINEWTLGDHINANGQPAWIELREQLGSAEMRHQSVELGQWCLQMWDILTKHDADFFDGVAYDWEVIPLMLGYALNQDGRPTIYAKELPPAQQTALLVARAHLYAEFYAECGREANKQWGYVDLVSDHSEKVQQAFELGEEPKEHVKWLGEKYDLTPRLEWERGF
jgi:hypothetical protein